MRVDRHGLAAVAVVTALVLAGCVGLEGASEKKAGESAVRPAASAPEVYPFYGVAQVGGGATAGLPVVPLRVSGEGALVGMEWAPILDSTRDVLAWFRYCGMEGSPALDHDAARDDRLRYFAPPEGVFADQEVWWADLHGEPVHAEDLEPGEFALASWRGAEGAGPLETPLLWIARLPPGEGPPEPFGHEGLVAFSARSTHFCTLVEPKAFLPGELPEAYVDGRAPGLGNESLVFVDFAHTGIWNPRWVVRDVMATALKALGPDLEAHAYRRAVAGEGCDRWFWRGFEEAPLEARPGDAVDGMFHLMTWQAAFRDLSWEVRFLNWTGPGEDAVVAAFPLDGPEAVGQNASVTVPVRAPVPENATADWRVQVAWEGEALGCGEWIRFPASWSEGNAAHVRIMEGTPP